MLNYLITQLPSLHSFAAGSCNARDPANFFFGLKPWYYYLELRQDNTGSCEVVNFTFLKRNETSDLLLVGLVIIDDLLRIAAMVAVGFLIWGGIQYVTSQGSPDQTGKAQNTIINALVGLVIALLSAGFVAFLGNRLA